MKISTTTTSFVYVFAALLNISSTGTHLQLVAGAAHNGSSQQTKNARLRSTTRRYLQQASTTNSTDDAEGTPPEIATTTAATATPPPTQKATDAATTMITAAADATTPNPTPSPTAVPNTPSPTIASTPLPTTSAPQEDTNTEETAVETTDPVGRPGNGNGNGPSETNGNALRFVHSAVLFIASILFPFFVAVNFDKQKNGYGRNATPSSPNPSEWYCDDGGSHQVVNVIDVVVAWNSRRGGKYGRRYYYDLQKWQL